ncbi:MAG: response regulator [Planctomycetaceae bacterium]
MESGNSDLPLKDDNLSIREIAHGLNNQVLVISCHCDQLLTRLSQEDPNRESVEAIIQACGRVADLVRGLQPASSVLNVLDEFRPDPRADALQTILLVEDEETIRRFMVSCLEAQGFTILEAAHGPEAIATALRYRGTIHLVITDVRLPEMDGFAVVDALRQHRPGLRAVFISGDAIGNRESGSPYSNNDFLWKPFKSSGLLQKVRDALQRNTD